MITLRDILEYIIENQDTYIGNRNEYSRYAYANGEPCCIVGHIVHGKGVELPAANTNQNIMSFPHTDMARAFMPSAIMFLGYAQIIADNYRGPKPRWGDAIYAACISTLREIAPEEKRFIVPLVDRWHEVMDEKGDGIYTLLHGFAATIGALTT